MSARYIKYLQADRSPAHGGQGHWEPGVWRSVRGPLVPCKHGLHLCRTHRGPDLLRWISAAAWEAEVPAGVEIIISEDKVVVRRARIVRPLACNAQTLRLFAADCAERALMRVPNPDRRSVTAIQVARRYAFGLATSDKLAAAWAAAGAAARAAARAAAWAAARPAAGAAARAAAWAAAGAAAGAAERAWQTLRLLAYFDEQVDLGAIRERVA